MNFVCSRCEVLGLKNRNFLTRFDPKTIEKHIAATEDVNKIIRRNLEKYLPGLYSSRGSHFKCFMLGNACSTEKLIDAIELLLNRDYPQICDIYNNKNIGQIFVPELFLTNVPKIVDPERLEEKIERYVIFDKHYRPITNSSDVFTNLFH